MSAWTSEKKVHDMDEYRKHTSKQIGLLLVTAKTVTISEESCFRYSNTADPTALCGRVIDPLAPFPDSLVSS